MISQSKSTNTALYDDHIIIRLKGIFVNLYFSSNNFVSFSAVQMNIEGTQMMVNLARKMPQLKAFIHTSTAFSHCYNEHIKEEFYPCTAFTPDDIIELCKMPDNEGGMIMKNVVSNPNFVSLGYKLEEIQF